MEMDITDCSVDCFFLGAVNDDVSCVSMNVPVRSDCHSVSVAEGTASVFRGVRPAAGEGAGPGPAEGGRVPVCAQRNARQDPRYGEGQLLQVHTSLFITRLTNPSFICMLNNLSAEELVTTR